MNFKSLRMGAGLLVSAFLYGGSVGTAGQVPEPKIFNVKTFGATGNGVTRDTKSLQEAIDACNAKGGGTVWVPSGRYHIGTIQIRSNVTLSLDYGAYLIFFGKPPAWDAYIRHARNIQFKNVAMKLRDPDARERIVLDDVENFAEH